MMCRSTSDLSLVASMQFLPNYLITMTAHIADISLVVLDELVLSGLVLRYENRSVNRVVNRDTGLEMPCHRPVMGLNHSK
jgi:hypothetical protein